MDKQALIGLAEMLDKARLQANSIDIYVIASQHGGVYGQIAQALQDTLEHIIWSPENDGNTAWYAGNIYQSLLDGNTVRQALEAVMGEIY